MTQNSQTPIVIHLGKKSRKQIKKYKKGIGNMFMEVQQLLAKAKSNADDGDHIVPVVSLHKKKKKKKKKSRSTFLNF